jgi:copper ion binding protein
MSEQRTYVVPGMTCDHCKVSITEEVQELAGVEAIEIDLDSKKVVVRGAELDDAAIRDAIAEAGYEVAA